MWKFLKIENKENKNINNFWLKEPLWKLYYYINIIIFYRKIKNRLKSSPPQMKKKTKQFVVNSTYNLKIK